MKNKHSLVRLKYYCGLNCQTNLKGQSYTALSKKMNYGRTVKFFGCQMKQGMDVRFEQVNLRGAHPNTVRLHVTGERGTALTLEAASVGGGNIEIHRINGLSVNFTGKADTMIIHHIDMPGAIAAVTSTLARHRVNIANMQVYRRKLGGDAMMVLELDGAPSQADLDIIRQIPDIRSCTFLKRRDD